jgi:3-oxoacyl-[acyl-carrier protein] reductase
LPAASATETELAGWTANVTHPLEPLTIPGPVYTELTSDIFPQRGPHPQIEGKRVKRPEDVAPLALFLAAHAPGGPTGQSFSLARRPI